MEPDQDRSIVPRPPYELAAPLIRPNRIVGEMVETALVLASEIAKASAPTYDLLKSWNETGDNHYYGRGVPQDYVAAVKWYRKAAEGGYAQAQYSLGHCLAYIAGVKKPGEAIHWFRLAAEQGIARAQVEMGIHYHRKDRSEEVRWLLKAAEQGDDLAQSFLSGIYSTTDPCESVMWCRKAAEQGNYCEQKRLGRCLHLGKGVPQNYCEAYAWLKLSEDARAAKHGITNAEYAQRWLTEATNLLSPTQLEQARVLYEDFKKKYAAKQ